MVKCFLTFCFSVHFCCFFADAQAFDLFDTDGSGEIDSKELKVRGVGSSDLVIAMVTEK